MCAAARTGDVDGEADELEGGGDAIELRLVLLLGERLPNKEGREGEGEGGRLRAVRVCKRREEGWGWCPCAKAEGGGCVRELAE